MSVCKKLPDLSRCLKAEGAQGKKQHHVKNTRMVKNGLYINIVIHCRCVKNHSWKEITLSLLKKPILRAFLDATKSIDIHWYNEFTFASHSIESQSLNYHSSADLDLLRGFQPITNSDWMNKQIRRMSSVMNLSYGEAGLLSIYIVCHVCSCFFHPEVVFMSFWCGLISHVPHQAASLPTQSFQHQHQTLPQQWHHLKLSVLKKYALVRGFKVVHRAGGCNGTSVRSTQTKRTNFKMSTYSRLNMPCPYLTPALHTLAC